MSDSTHEQVMMAVRPVGQLSLDERGTALIDTTFVVVDLETSGLDPTASDITEIGAVKVCGGDVVGEFQSFINIGSPLPARITAITGITDAMLATAPPLTAVLPQFLAFAGDHILIAHNVPFDLGFLRAAVAQVYGDPFNPRTLDTVRLARRLLGDEVHNFRLGTLARRFNSPITPDHRALSDARATVHVFHALVERAAGFGATTVEDLADLTRASATPQARRKTLIAQAPHTPGVYRFIGQNNETLYVGKATDLRQRLASYFGSDNRRRIATMVREAKTVVWDPTDTVLDAEVRELRAIAAEQPRFNVRHRREQRQVDVVLTTDVFPRLKIVAHDPQQTATGRLGPFPSHRSAALFVAAVAETTGLRDCSMPIRKAQNHAACIRKDLKKCPAPCDGTADQNTYLPSVDAAARSLNDPSQLLACLRDTMNQRAKAQRFEDAKEARDALHHLAFVLHRGRQIRAVHAAGQLVAVRPNGPGCDTIVVSNGALVHASNHKHLLDDMQVASWAADYLQGGVQEPLAEETVLIANWLAASDTRLVFTSGSFTSHAHGGASLADTLNEGRHVRRALHKALRQADFSAAATG